MKNVGLALAGLALLGAASISAAQATTQPAPVVRTQSGRVQGVSADGVAVFKGLPYATPPVGELRWREPQPPSPWKGVRKADSFGNACPQDPSAASLEGGGDPGPLSEDCLTLNVWTPAPDASVKRPVMVWIHGGALVIGSSSPPIYDGTAFAARGAVVVTINYRLGALGFFAHPAIAGKQSSGPVNFGLLDQIAALEWVRDNIASFGGDPGNVTIFGESAGGESVLALLASPKARGLFHKGIAQSAYGIPSNSREKARTVAINVASALGLNGERATAAQLRAVPADRFWPLKGKGLSLAPGFVVGDAALPETILSVFQKHREAKVPLIVGSNSDEATIATAFGVDPAKIVERLGAGKILVRAVYPGVSDNAQLGREAVRDLLFTAFARRIAYLHSQAAPTWRYYFSYVQSAQRAKVPGVAHGGEIPFVMGTGDLCGCLPAPFSNADRDVSRRVGDHWFEFARTGVPSSRGAAPWPRDGVRNAQTMEFGDEPAVRPDFMKARLDVFIGALKVVGKILDTK
jgi:para-nitrobenzyl esterase